jgi:hypothetical protein
MLTHDSELIFLRLLICVNLLDAPRLPELPSSVPRDKLPILRSVQLLSGTVAQNARYDHNIHIRSHNWNHNCTLDLIDNHTLYT